MDSTCFGDGNCDFGESDFKFLLLLVCLFACLLVCFLKNKLIFLGCGVGFVFAFGLLLCAVGRQGFLSVIVSPLRGAMQLTGREEGTCNLKL